MLSAFDAGGGDAFIDDNDDDDNDAPNIPADEDEDDDDDEEDDEPPPARYPTRERRAPVEYWDAGIQLQARTAKKDIDAPQKEAASTSSRTPRGGVARR